MHKLGHCATDSLDREGSDGYRNWRDGPRVGHTLRRTHGLLRHDGEARRVRDADDVWRAHGRVFENKVPRQCASGALRNVATLQDSVAIGAHGTSRKGKHSLYDYHYETMRRQKKEAKRQYRHNTRAQVQKEGPDFVPPGRRPPNIFW